MVLVVGFSILTPTPTPTPILAPGDMPPDLLSGPGLSLLVEFDDASDKVGDDANPVMADEVLDATVDPDGDCTELEAVDESAAWLDAGLDVEETDGEFTLEAALDEGRDDEAEEDATCTGGFELAATGACELDGLPLILADTTAGSAFQAILFASSSPNWLS